MPLVRVLLQLQQPSPLPGQLQQHHVMLSGLQDLRRVRQLTLLQVLDLLQRSS